MADTFDMRKKYWPLNPQMEEHALKTWKSY
jgi:hypothetical protein